VPRSKRFLFDDLVASVQFCSICPRMQGRRRVLDHHNGNLDSTIVFIAPLGRTALIAFNIIHPHKIKLPAGVSKVFDWQGYKVYSLYHLGPKAFIVRTKNQQIDDYDRLAKPMVVRQ
jgi:hypothetical protein